VIDRDIQKSQPQQCGDNSG